MVIIRDFKQLTLTVIIYYCHNSLHSHKKNEIEKKKKGDYKIGVSKLLVMGRNELDLNRCSQMGLV